MSYQQEIKDLSPELISLARMIARDCRAAGHYTLDFTVGHHKHRIERATLNKSEPIRIIDLPER